MKKIYFKPEMESTECVMMMANICESPQPPQNPNDKDPFAPKRKVF